MSKMNRKLAGVCMLAFLVGMLLAGCVSVGENNSTDLPWSKPAAWEDQSLAIPIN